MPSAAYFRRQADICLRLSVIASDQDLVMRLLAMADDYKAKAGEKAGERTGALERADASEHQLGLFHPAMGGSEDLSNSEMDRD